MIKETTDRGLPTEADRERNALTNEWRGMVLRGYPYGYEGGHGRGCGYGAENGEGAEGLKMEKGLRG